MMACTSPGPTARSMPLRISLPSTPAWRFLISSMVWFAPFMAFPVPSPTPLSLTPPPFQADPSSFCASTANSIGSSRKTSLQKPFTIIDTASSRSRAALLAVEDLVLADLGGGGLVLHLRDGVLDLDVRERVRAALVADQQRVALRVVARAVAPSCGSSPGRGRCSGRGRPRCPWRRSCSSCSCRCGSSWCRCRPAGSCWSPPPSRTRRPSCRPAGCSSGTSR